MKLIFVSVTIAVCCAAAGCAGPRFYPATVEGAQCVRECAASVPLCKISMFTCARADRECKESCQNFERLDMDRMVKELSKKKSTE